MGYGWKPGPFFCKKRYLKSHDWKQNVLFTAVLIIITIIMIIIIMIISVLSLLAGHVRLTNRGH